MSKHYLPRNRQHPLYQFLQDHPDLTASQVAEATGYTYDAVRGFANLMGHTLPSAQRKVFIPSQAQIEVAAAEVRSTWSDDEKCYRRLGLRVSEVERLEQWNPPTVTVPIDRDRQLSE